jgi:hypothetical protein
MGVIGRSRGRGGTQHIAKTQLTPHILCFRAARARAGGRSGTMSFRICGGENKIIAGESQKQRIVVNGDYCLRSKIHD